MIRLYKPYEGDKRRNGYRVYLNQWSLKLGLLNKNKNISEEIVLSEERTLEDYYKIIMYLSRLLPVDDIIRLIVENIHINEPLSTRGWYTSIYDILRESKISKVLIEWQMSVKPTKRSKSYIRKLFLSSMNLPNSNYKKQLMRYLKTKPTYNPRTMNVHSWIKLDKEYEAVSWIDSPKVLNKESTIYTPHHSTDCYSRVLDHTFTESKRVNWRESGESWIKKINYIVYTPYRIKWELCKDCKFSREFIEKKRKALTLKRPHDYNFNPQSPWIRIECGNRYYYINKETHKKKKEEPLEGFSNVNITDIYYFDRNVPVF